MAHHTIRQDVGFKQDQLRQSSKKISSALPTRISRSPICARSSSTSLIRCCKQNATRSDFAQRLQRIIDAYNAGSSSADNYFDELIKFTQDLQEESERHIREDLTEDELELFDLLEEGQDDQ